MCYGEEEEREVGERRRRAEEGKERWEGERRVRRVEGGCRNEGKGGRERERRSMECNYSGQWL